MPLGISTTASSTQVSTREQLLKSPVVNGHGVPAHTPEIASQDYYDVDNLTKLYVWRVGAWSTVITLV